MPKKKPGTYTAKNGARYRILANGRARFISGPTKRGGGKKKGGGMYGKKGGMLGVGRAMNALNDGRRNVAKGVKSGMRQANKAVANFMY